MYGEGARKTFDFSKPLVGGPLDCGFVSFFGLTKAPSGPPYFYIRGREPVARPTEKTLGTKRDFKANDKDSRTAYAGGDIAPGFVPEECNAAFSDEAVKIVNEYAEAGLGKPLFLYYAMLEPHVPWLPGEDFAGKSEAGSYGDYIVQLDHEVGRILATLKETGLEKDTLVIFSSDNGALWRPQDIERFGHRANGVFSGTKGTAYEGGGYRSLSSGPITFPRRRFPTLSSTIRICLPHWRTISKLISARLTQETQKTATAFCPY